MAGRGTCGGRSASSTAAGPAWGKRGHRECRTFRRGRRYINWFAADPTRFAKSGLMNVEFKSELPQSLLTARPLAMLVQVLDTSHLRVGFKARAADPWIFSKTLDTKSVFGKSISKISYPCLASFQGSAGQKGWGVGNYPAYQQFLIDYVRFRASGTAR